MAAGEGLITFFPNNVQYLTNNGSLSGVVPGQIQQVFDPVSYTNRLSMYYNDVKSTGPYAWYFDGVMPSQYASGTNITLNANIAFSNVASYSGNPFYVNFACGFQRLDTNDTAVNVDVPSWGLQTQSSPGFISVNNYQALNLAMLIPASAVNNVQPGDLFRFYFTAQNNSNSFIMTMYVLNITLTEAN